MPVVLTFLVYAGRILSRPMDARLKQRQAGPFLVLALAVVIPALWVQFRPTGLATLYFWGELAGVWVIYLLSCSLVLATRARWLEPWFGGLDRMYLWHKRATVLATVALAPHLLTGSGATRSYDSPVGLGLGVVALLGLLALVLVSLPRVEKTLRLPYRWWLFLHRLTGMFVLVALVHGVLLDRVVGGSPLLMTVYLIIGGIGVLAYAYAELVMRRRAPTASYVVDRVDRPSATILDLTLAPVGGAVALRAGQFVFLRVGGDDASRDRPFTVAGSDPHGGLRLTIRSRGRGTTAMHARLKPGLPASVTGPYGMFDYTLGRDHQVWVAGGIGISPFLAWLSALHADDAYRVDLFYSTATEADAVYLDELHAAERRLAPVLRVHPVFTRAEGHLTAATIAALTDLTAGTHVFLCGPDPMVRTLGRDLHRRGVPRDYIHSETFSFR